MNKYIGNNKQDKCCLGGNNGTRGKKQKQLTYFREFWKVQAETCLKGWWKSAGEGEGKDNSKPREHHVGSRENSEFQGTE